MIQYIKDNMLLYESEMVWCVHILATEPQVINNNPTSQPMALHNSFYRLIDPWNILDEAPVHFCGCLGCAVTRDTEGICAFPSRSPVRLLLWPEPCRACIYHQTTAAAQQAHTTPSSTERSNWGEWSPHTGLQFGVSCYIFNWPDK